jgi:aminoglycoside 3-N-acetyltransferase I
MEHHGHVVKLEKSDLLHFQELLVLFNEIFESEQVTAPGESYLNFLLAKPDFLVFVLMVENKVMGGATGYVLPKYYSEGSELYLYDVAVHPDIQRQGFGRELIEAVKKYCADHGIGEMFVDAHAEDIHAIEFYHSTGGRVDNVFHFTYTIENNAFKV